MMPKSVIEYWRIYGGFRAVLSSPYFIFSELLILLALAVTDPAGDFTQKWPSVAVSVIPSMLAFSLSALTIFMTLGEGPTLSDLRDGGKSDSAFMHIVFAMFHFILVQVIALTISLMAIIEPHPIIVVIGMLLTFYSIFCGLAAAVVVLGVGRLKNVSG